MPITINLGQHFHILPPHTGIYLICETIASGKGGLATYASPPLHSQLQGGL